MKSSGDGELFDDFFFFFFLFHMGFPFKFFELTVKQRWVKTVTFKEKKTT